MTLPVTDSTTALSPAEAANAAALAAADSFGATVQMGGSQVEVSNPESTPAVTTPDASTTPEVTDSDDSALEASMANSLSAAKEVTEVLTKQGVDVAALSAELEDNGALSDASYAALAAQGYSRETVDAYLSGVDAVGNQYVQSVYASVGGEAEFNKLSKWAASNLPQGTLDAFNAASSNGQLATTKLLLQGMQAAYVKANGTNNPTLLGTANTPAVKAYANYEEMQSAMSDPRYKRGDKTFHAEVKARLAATDWM